MPATTQDVLGHCVGALAIRLRHAWAHARCKRKCWFFYRAVVIRMQCSRSPRALDDNRHSLRLGGQHGEEAKDEDEVSGEEGRAQDKAPEEEVKYSPLSVFDFEGVVDCVTRAGASRRAVSASRRASTPPVPVDGRGRRRDGGSGPTDLGDFRKAGPSRIFRTSTAAVEISAAGFVPRPLADALGIPDMISPTLFPRLGLVLPTGRLWDCARVPI
jgi:hypothetical protein